MEENWTQYTELQIFQMALFGEAEGEGIIGQLAVGMVIRNRVEEEKYGKGYRGVILRPFQFSSFNDNSPRIPKMIQFLKVPGTGRLYNQIWWIASGIYKGFVQDDITKGANHFLTIDLAESDDRPSWFDGDKITATIKNHVFLRL